MIPNHSHVLISVNHVIQLVSTYALSLSGEDTAEQRCTAVHKVVLQAIAKQSSRRNEISYLFYVKG